MSMKIDKTIDGSEPETVRESVLWILKNTSSILKASVSAGIALGAAFLLLYAMHIDYLPQDFSLGDGSLFVLVAFGFALIYLLFSVSCLCLGLLPFYSVSWIVRLARGKTALPKKLAFLDVLEWCSRAFLLVFMATIAIFLMYIAEKESGQQGTAYFALSCLSACLTISYIGMTEVEKQLRACSQRLMLETVDTEKQLRNQIRQLVEARRYLLIAFVALPVGIGWLGNFTLVTGMRLTNVRVERAAIFLKEPYDGFFQHAAPADGLPTLKDFQSVGVGTVLFRGFGKLTVIRMEQGDRCLQREIPNDSIIAIRLPNLPRSSARDLQSPCKG
jgi:hypothetical protein